MRVLLRYAAAQVEERRYIRAFHNYVTDCLQNISENTAKYGGGGYVSARFADIIVPKKVDNRSAEQVIADVIAGAGLEVNW